MSFAELPALMLYEERRPVAAATEPLATAAAALGVGEPKRAIAALAEVQGNGDEGLVAAVIRHVAAALDTNWFPGGGGAVLTGDAVAAFVAPRGEATHPDAQLVVTLGRRLLAPTPSWRSIADGARTGGGGEGFALGQASELLTDIYASMPRLVGPVALVLADLLVRAGRGNAELPFQLARGAYADDPVGLAACALAELDARWPGGRPELLGETLDSVLAPPPPPDPDLPARLADVAAMFAAAGSDRGVAAVALRQSRAAADMGDRDGARAHLGRAVTLASRSGDTALLQVAGVHGGLLEIELGGRIEPAAVAEPVIAWATTVGSTSWARGLVRLCARRAERWRDDDPIRSQWARRLAAALAEGVGATLESTLARRAQAAWYGAVNDGRAALRLLLGDLTDAMAADDPATSLHLVQWASLVDMACAAERDAATVRDSDLLTAVHTPLQWLADRAPAPAAEGDVTNQIRQLLAGAVTEGSVLVPLYRGTAARDAGDPATAAASFAEALAAAKRLKLPILTAVVLATTRRFPEAVAVIEPLWRSGQLAHDLAASFFTLLGAFDLAMQAEAALPPDDGSTWDRPALQAEIALGQGRAADAVTHAETAISRFEGRLERLSRDVLRTTALDSPPVARMYTTAVAAHIALGAEHHDRAFALSDRCRGMTLTDLVDADRDATTPAAALAIRAWQQAGAELARTVEDLAGVAAPGDIARARIDAAETALLDAEAALAAAAPEVLHNRRRLPEPMSIARLQAELTPDTLLLQYHAFDDRLVIFAVTHDQVVVRTAAAVTGQLTCDARRFLRTVAAYGIPADTGRQLGASLAGTLLDPVADVLAAQRRIVVVPFGGLSALPFHLLPFGAGELGTGGRIVSYLPAVSAVVGKPFTRSATGAPLVVGDPAYRPGLPPLPGTRVEAHAVADLLGVAPLLGGAVGHEAVLRQLADAPLVHLATHTTLRESAPYSAALELAGGEQLSVPDLMGLGLHVDLAALSACSSGRGRATAAGDVIGLTRALLGSGVRGLVVSLWPVDDVFACLTMIDFQQLIREKVAPAEALAQAAQKLRTTSADDAEKRYAELLAATPGAELGERIARDVEGERPGEPKRPTISPAHPAAWAPFVYVGLP